jgi:hypothetical protein
MMSDDERPDRGPTPRAWREEFDGLKPIRPIAYKKPAAKTEEPRALPKRGRLARLD